MYSHDALFVRFEEDGAVDTGFGVDGEATVAAGGIRAILIDPAGNLVGAGTSTNPSNGFQDSLIVRLDSSGLPDLGFGTNGVVRQDLAVPLGATDGITSVLGHSSGRLLVGAYAYGRGLTIAAYTTSGTLDPTFGVGGVAATSLATLAFGLGEQADAKIVAVGADYDGLTYDVALARFDQDGTIDPMFGSGGVAVRSFSTQDDQGLAVFVQPDEEIVVAGRSGSAALVARFESGGPSQPIAASKLLIRNPVAGPSSNQLIFGSRDPNAATPATPFEDPRCAPDGSGAGGELTVSGAGRTFTIPLPCSGWTMNRLGTRLVYRDPSKTTCGRVKIVNGYLQSATCRGTQVAYTLGAVEGTVSVVLSTGAAGAERRACAAFSPSTATVMREGSNRRLYWAKKASAPASCP